MAGGMIWRTGGSLSHQHISLSVSQVLNILIQHRQLYVHAGMYEVTLETLMSSYGYHHIMFVSMLSVNQKWPASGSHC